MLITELALPTFWLYFAFAGINFRDMLHRTNQNSKHRSTNWLINCMFGKNTSLSTTPFEHSFLWNVVSKLAWSLKCTAFPILLWSNIDSDLVKKYARFAFLGKKSRNVISKQFCNLIFLPFFLNYSNKWH